MTDRPYDITINLKYNGYQRGLVGMVCNFFDKKTGSRVSVNKELLQELHKSEIKKFKKRNVCDTFKDNIWAADLAEMGSLSLRIKVLNIYYVF